MQITDAAAILENAEAAAVASNCDDINSFFISNKQTSTNGESLCAITKVPFFPFANLEFKETKRMKKENKY